MLTVDSKRARRIPESLRKAAWFVFTKNRGSRHSAGAAMLPSIMNRCEQEQLAYQLTALPGVGYRIRLLDVAEITPEILQHD